jgi:hypothetical protein
MTGNPAGYPPAPPMNVSSYGAYTTGQDPQTGPSYPIPPQGTYAPPPQGNYEPPPQAAYPPPVEVQGAWSEKGRFPTRRGPRDLWAALLFLAQLVGFILLSVYSIMKLPVGALTNLTVSGFFSRNTAWFIAITLLVGVGLAIGYLMVMNRWVVHPMFHGILGDQRMY